MNRQRRLAAAGAVGALVVVTIFATVGDGVTAEGNGWSALVIDWGHLVAWLFIALALGTSALLPQAKRLATGFGWAAAASYLGFLATLLGTDAL